MKALVERIKSNNTELKINNDENLGIYLLFNEYIINLSNAKYSEAYEKLSKMIEISSGNPLIMNNMALMNFYLNKIEKSITDFYRIIDKNEMNLINDISYFNYNSVLGVIAPSSDVVKKK